MKHKEPPRLTPDPTPETKAIFDLRHTKACSIGYFREEMEKMERSRNKALAELAELKEAPTKPKPKPKAQDILYIVEPIVDIDNNTANEEEAP